MHHGAEGIQPRGLCEVTFNSDGSLGETHNPSGMQQCYRGGENRQASKNASKRSKRLRLPDLSQKGVRGTMLLVVLTA